MTLAILLWFVQDLGALSAEGASAMRSQRYADAVRVYRTLLEKDAANPMWRFNLGLAHFYSGAAAAAAGELQAFLRARPEPGAAHLFLGLASLKLRQPCAAIAPLESALRWAHRPPSTLIELADANQGCARWEPAAKAYAEAAKANPQDLRLTRQLAYCWRMARRYDLAKPAYASLPASFQEEAEFQFEYGDTLVRLEGAAAGLPWLERAVVEAPALLAAQSALGRALMELERPAAAVPHLEAAAKEDPALWLPLSRAYRALNRPGDAAKAEAAYKAQMKAH